jgi:hypothetical protein
MFLFKIHTSIFNTHFSCDSWQVFGFIDFQNPKIIGGLELVG